MALGGKIGVLGKKEWQLPVAFVCLCLGFLLAVQLQTQSTLRYPSTLPSRRIETAVTLLQQVEHERDQLRQENESLRAAVAGNASSKASQRELVAELHNAQVLAGLTRVTGPGVVITLSDSNRPARSGEDQDVYLIHAEDLLATVNELRAAGAEAIAINGQRIVSTTAIRCVGPTALINTTRVAPPFTIAAIGQPDELRQVDMRGGVLDSLRAWGITAELSVKDLLVLPAYTGGIGTSLAKTE